MNGDKWKRFFFSVDLPSAARWYAGTGITAEFYYL